MSPNHRSHLPVKRLVGRYDLKEPNQSRKRSDFFAAYYGFVHIILVKLINFQIHPTSSCPGSGK
jgi:hypothetical protein